MLFESPDLVTKISSNTTRSPTMAINLIPTMTMPSRFRTAMTEAGFTVAGEEHAICPVAIMLTMLIIIDHFDDDYDGLVSGDALG